MAREETYTGEWGGETRSGMQLKRGCELNYNYGQPELNPELLQSEDSMSPRMNMTERRTTIFTSQLQSFD